MLNNEERGIIISYLESIDSIFGYLDFNDEKVPWDKNEARIGSFNMFQQDNIDDENKRLEKSLEYFVGVLSRNFVNLFITSGVKLMLEERGQFNAEKSREIYEFISKNSINLNKSISSLNNRITEFVKDFRDSALNSGAFIERLEQERF